MTPEHTALVADLDKAEINLFWRAPAGKAADAIRALAGEVEQLEEELETAEAVHDGVALERDTLRAEVAALKVAESARQAAHDEDLARLSSTLDALSGGKQ